MPWMVESVMSQKLEFIMLVRTGEFKFKELCQRFNISRPTGYKWVSRARALNDSLESLKDKSKKPRTSPCQTESPIEKAIIDLRRTYPYWGARKLGVLLKERYPNHTLPCERTINRIISKNGLLEETSPKGVEFKRFEYKKPNELWQMDYKGDFLTKDKIRCYPLTVSDDYSRYNLVLDAHRRLSQENVKQSLIATFRDNGLPQKILVDRGPIWYGNSSLKYHWTMLTVWLMKLGIGIIHSSARHPQTLGKEERFHRTLKNDLLDRQELESIKHAQELFNHFRHEYNYIRPHEGIGLKRPFERYAKSAKPFPDRLPKVEYPKGSLVKKVNSEGHICYKSIEWLIHGALAGEYVQLIDEGDGLIKVYYSETCLRTLNLKERTYK